MADSGLRRRFHKGDEDDDDETVESYNQGSDVPPPPSYDEALQLGSEKKNNDDATTESEDIHAPIAMIDEDDDDLGGATASTQPEGARNDVGESGGGDDDDDNDDGGDDDDDDDDSKEDQSLARDEIIVENEGATANAETELDAKRKEDARIMRQESFKRATNQVDLDEIEMMDINNDNSSPAAMDTLAVDTVDGRYSPRHSDYGDRSSRDDPDAESNRRRRQRRDSFDCEFPIPGLSQLINYIANLVIRTYDNWPDSSIQKRAIVVLCVLFIIGLVLLVSLLPASFVYVEYYEMGFVHNQITKKTDTSRVVQYGCHLFAPQDTMILFPATAQYIDLNLASINSDGLNLKVEVHFQYFLRPSELSTLYGKYHMKYHEVLENKAETLLKTAVTGLTVEELRLNRTFVQHVLFQALRLGLSGDCCSNMESTRGSQYVHNKTACDASKSCSQGQHVDVSFFQLAALDIPYQVTQNYLKQFTLQLEAERELQIQEGAVVRKETVAKVKNIENQAKEIRETAYAASKKIKAISVATRMQMLELSYARALNATYRKLDITEEDEKISLLYYRSLKDAKDNLFSFSYNYDVNKIYDP